jgi:hypothetical protein
MFLYPKIIKHEFEKLFPGRDFNAIYLLHL